MTIENLMNTIHKETKLNSNAETSAFQQFNVT